MWDVTRLGRDGVPECEMSPCSKVRLSAQFEGFIRERYARPRHSHVRLGFHIDVNCQSVKETPYFVGRERIVDNVANELIRRSRGSILVCGQRGTGKTAIVHQAIARATAQLPSGRPSRKWMIVPVNAAQFDGVPDAGEESSQQETVRPRRLLQVLIRRLANTAMAMDGISGKAREAVDHLYEKASAKNWTESRSISANSESLESVTTERTASVGLSDALWRGLAALAISSPLLAGTSQIESLPWRILSSLAAAAIPFLALGYTSGRSAKTNSGSTRKHSVGRAVDLDNSLDNLEHDLESVHAVLADEVQVVYVVDEMDKLTAQSVLSSLKYFKQLITTSDATFIFVGDERLFDEVGRSASPNAKDRSPYYTCFTSKYYIDRPRSEEAEQYLNRIAEHDMDVSQWRILVRSLLYEAKNDFYDLKLAVRNRVTSSDAKHRPIMDSAILYDDGQKARYQRAVSILLEGLYLGVHPSSSRHNDQLWAALWESAEAIRNSPEGARIEPPQPGDVIGSAICDFHALLYRLGRLAHDVERERQHAENQRGRQNGHHSPQDYWVVAKELGEPPDALDAPTEYEQELLDCLDTIAAYALAVINAPVSYRGNALCSLDALTTSQERQSYLDRHGFSYSRIFREYVPVRDAILAKEKRRREQFNREEMEQWTQKAKGELDAVKRGMVGIISRVVVEEFPQYELKHADHFARSAMFPEEAKSVGTALIPRNPTILHSGNQQVSQKLVFLHGHTDVLCKIRKEIAAITATHLIVQVTEHEGEEQPEGVSRVEIDTPERLQKCLVSTLRTIGGFLAGGRKASSVPVGRGVAEARTQGKGA